MIVQTPGVYITEKNILPPSVAGVSTAVPLFIGITEKQPAQNKAIRIKNMFEFENIFGKGYNTRFDINLTATLPAVPDKRFFLYDSLHLYFRNGGGPCYIKSAEIYENITTVATLNAALTGVESELDTLDEVTLVAVPDLHVQFKDGTTTETLAIGGEYKTIASAILSKCAALKDKFAIFDYLDTDSDTTDVRNAISPTLSKELSYGSLYYPWLKNATAPYVSASQLLNISSSTSFETTFNTVNADVNALKSKFGQFFTFEGLKSEFNQLKLAFANISANATATQKKAALKNLFVFLYGLIENLDDVSLTDGSIVQHRNDLATKQDFIGEIKKMFWYKDKIDSFFPTWGLATFNTNLNAKWINQAGDTYADYNALLGDSGNLNYTTPADIDALRAQIKSLVPFNSDILFAGIASLFDTASARKKATEDQLFANDSTYASARDAAQNYLKEIPSQGAVMGIYCTNDRNRGIWKSPANIAVQGIENPLVEVSNAEQDSLNVDATTGKSVNVIRSFTGKGALVWGARTLNGNSNEWRYIAVRRFFNYAEESIKKAMHSFVFEPNNERTWVKIKAMVVSFLVDQWQAGALVGTKMNEAFFVNVGKDTTSETEILAGKINVQIGMAVARPAEFIILEFSHYTKS